ncbi:MAG TPA: flagellar export protein FliJ [Tepidisphaeraceae bacterium]|jgi:flagellar FliJ protein|nr:flagellar export protein FliJ [Tepidisphaeraceae bacterium]
MPKFVFQLDGVLRQRKYVEQQKQREFAERQAVLTQMEGELKGLNEQVQITNDDVRRNHLTGTLDMNFLAAHRRFLIAIQRQALSLVQKMAQAKQRVEEARKELAEAAKQRKVIEKLREKHFERWRAALKHRELTEQDEIGMQLSYWNIADGKDAEAIT